MKSLYEKNLEVELSSLGYDRFKIKILGHKFKCPFCNIYHLIDSKEGQACLLKINS